MKSLFFLIPVLIILASTCAQKKIENSRNESDSLSGKSNTRDSSDQIDFTPTPIDQNEINVENTPERSMAENKITQGIITAFFTVTVPGAQQVDENGNAIENFIINRFAYLETKDDNGINFTQATYGTGFLYDVSTTKAADDKIVVGVSYASRKDVIIHAKPGNTLWLLKLTKKGGDKESVTPYNRATFNGTIKGKSIQIVSGPEVQLKGQLLY